MLEKAKIVEIPAKQKMERQATLAREHNQEHKAALQRAVTLAVPHAYSPSQYGTFSDPEEGDNPRRSSEGSSYDPSKKSMKKESWDEMIDRLFEKDETGHLLFKKPNNDNSC